MAAYGSLSWLSKALFPRTVSCGFKRVYAATGILHILCGDLVLERRSPVPEHDGAIQSPFDRTGPRERCGIQHARIPEGLQLQEGAAHGAGKRLLRLVEVRRDQLLPSLNISEGRGSWQPPTPAPLRELPATTYRSQSSQMRGPGSPGQWLLQPHRMSR